MSLLKAKPLQVTSVILIFLFCGSSVSAQRDTLLVNTGLDEILQYAVRHQPQLKQSYLNQEITSLQVQSKLADWYPQVNFSYNYQHNFDVSTSIIGGNPVQLGVHNTSNVQLNATQNIFTRDLLLAKDTKADVLQSAAYQTENIKINLMAAVAKSYYDLLATQQQIKVTDENIIRLQKNLADARARYDAGVVDKTDYKRATIALNNVIASRKQLEEAVHAKTANLKYLINYPAEKSFSVLNDSIALEREIFIDSTGAVDYKKRVEYQQLQTMLRLQDANLRYNKWSYLPTLSANGAYIRNFLNDKMSDLYKRSYPNSYAGITLAFPVFQGGKRKYNIGIAEKQYDQAKLNIESFISQANSEYSTAMANYKASYANYQALKENLSLAAEVYEVIQLQYREGIKTYLELITAETDLRTAQVNYFNAVYGLLSSKIDVQKAKGELQVPR